MDKWISCLSIVHRFQAVQHIQTILWTGYEYQAWLYSSTTISHDFLPGFHNRGSVMYKYLTLIFHPAVKPLSACSHCSTDLCSMFGSLSNYYSHAVQDLWTSLRWTPHSGLHLFLFFPFILFISHVRLEGWVGYNSTRQHIVYDLSENCLICCCSQNTHGVAFFMQDRVGVSCGDVHA